MSTTTDAPDLAVIKQRQRATWSSGDYSGIGALIVRIAEDLCDAADLRAGSRVLDVATGSGNAAIAAARLGCEVVGIDYVPALLERGRERAAAEGLPVDLREGDAEDLPFPDASFDAVVSVVGAMFAPDHRRTAAEMVRVARPGATLALASWTPEGFIGDLFRTVASHVPPPRGVASPMLWGTEDHLGAIFGDAVRWTHRRRTFTFRFASAEGFADRFVTLYGPTLKAAESLGDGRDSLVSDLVDLARRGDRLGGGGAVAVDAEYLESVGARV